MDNDDKPTQGERARSRAIKIPKAKKPVPLAHRDALRRLVDRLGERGALRAVGLSRLGFYRALTGFDVNPGTRALIREAVERASRPPEESPSHSSEPPRAA